MSSRRQDTFNFLIINRARGPCWGILARGRGSTDRAQRGPYKNDRGPIFPSMAGATTSCKNSGDTSPSWGVINFPIISHTAAPLPSLSVLLARQKKCWELKQSTLKGGEGRGSGKGLNSRYAEYWKLEKVFFNESVSTILQTTSCKK